MPRRLAGGAAGLGLAGNGAAAVQPAARPKMLWDLSSLALGQASSVVLSFAGFAYLARTLSPDSYGLIEYAAGLAGVGAIVIEGGMGPVGAARVARRPDRAPAIAAQVPFARLLVALAAIPLVGLSAHATGADPRTAGVIWLFAASLAAVPFRQDWLLQGLDRITHVAPAQAVKSAAFTAGVVLAVRRPDDVLRVGLVEVAAALLCAGYLVGAQRALSVPFGLDLRASRALALIRAGAAVAASNIAWPIMLAGPLLLVAHLSGATDAAWLGSAQRIVVALVSFSALYFFNLYPLIVRGLTGDRSDWQRLMGSSVRVIAWSSVGAGLALTLLAPPLVTLAFGGAFLAAAPVLALYAWVLPIRLLSGHARWTLLAAGKGRTLLVTELAGAAVVILGAALLIPAYGAAGAAAGVLAGNLVGWLLAHASVLRSVGALPSLWQVAPAAAAAAGAFALGGTIDAAPAWRTGIALSAYALCLIAGAPRLFADAVRLAYAKKHPVTGTGAP